MTPEHCERKRPSWWQPASTPPKAHGKQLQQQTIAHHKNTLWPVCEEWLHDNRANWSAYYHDQATRFLTRYVKGSSIRTMPDRDIKTAQIYNLLVSIAKRKSLARDERKAAGAPHISVRLRQHLDAIFMRAIIRGLADANPVAAPKVSDVVTLPTTRHNRALEADELKRLLDAFIVVEPHSRVWQYVSCCLPPSELLNCEALHGRR
jgi:integrase